MKKLLWIGGAVVAVFIILIVIQNMGQSQQLENNTQYDTDDLDPATIDQLDDPNYQNVILPDELEEKLENGEDAIVYFFSPTCRFCVEATPVLMDIADDEDVYIDQYNVLEYESASYGIQSTPTLIAFEDGQEVRRVTGNQEAETFRAFLNGEEPPEAE
ncbi:thioredoxin family protein [Shouchella sp. JSM 1781072]|uniref:thioredoxin family protein n=1 Tax=Bacillaceae TaxID=186817 RepID=UPI000C077485|nr:MULTISPECIES: thioredoxin family protein [Bacillaceae]UTR06337.1 thioredoxin family protein [Alkalihalobacillus sp. LMS6]